MTLYSIHPDLDNYADIGFDRAEVERKYGSDIRAHIDLSCKPRSYSEIWKGLTVEVLKEKNGVSGDKTADILAFKGKLFLNEKAFSILQPLIENDGEFLPVKYECGNGYIFNPLSLAEDVDGVDSEKSHINSYGDVDSMAFHEDRVSMFSVFKSSFDKYQSVICQDAVKNAIESGGLGGVYFNTDLGDPFTANISQHIKPN